MQSLDSSIYNQDLIGNATEQIYDMLKLYLPLVGRFSPESDQRAAIEAVWLQGRYLISVDYEGRILGFVESYRLDDTQAAILIERVKFETRNPESPFYKPFYLGEENLTEGPIVWIDNIVIHKEHRVKGKFGPVYKDLSDQYWLQNKDAEVHMGHAMRKFSGLIKILKRRKRHGIKCAKKFN